MSPVLSAAELDEAWRLLSTEDRVEGFQLLPRAEAQEFLLGLSPTDLVELILALPPAEQRLWMRLLEPDDAADVVQAAALEDRDGLLALLDEATRREVKTLTAYAEDEAGGLARIFAWEGLFGAYGDHWLLLGLTVALSLLGVVLWGTLAGSMLPLVLDRLGLDPASASAPFVATVVDVTGLVIYFSVASLLLTGTLL
jgi:Mg/Co/Ni transporter MgtE